MTRRTDPEPAVETRVPPDADAERCDRCGLPFRTERQLALHRGLAHPHDLDSAEREAYNEAEAAEEDELRRYRILALGGLVVLYFGFLFAYALA